MIRRSHSQTMHKKTESQVINKYITLPKEKEKYEPDADTIKTLSEKWKIKILPNIGYGGFSMVKLVQSKDTDKYYACKIVNLYNI